MGEEYAITGARGDETTAPSNKLGYETDLNTSPDRRDNFGNDIVYEWLEQNPHILRAQWENDRFRTRYMEDRRKKLTFVDIILEKFGFAN